jgi:hypothetical protein
MRHTTGRVSLKSSWFVTVATVSRMRSWLVTVVTAVRFFSGRLTPHAFSHFSFLHSGGQRMIVDIQGVGNLWTDPQVRGLVLPNLNLNRNTVAQHS